MLSFNMIPIATALSILFSGISAGPLIAERWAPSLPACANTTDFVYAGCFIDPSSPSALLFRPTDLNSQNMTVEICVDFCKGNGYKYAGLEYYGECFCGASVGGPQTAESNCSFPCTGNKNESCGGNDILSVYQDTTFPTVNDTTISDYTPMGCYSDLGPNGRTLAWKQDQIPNADLTIESCLSACKKGGYPFAGVEYSQECYCGVVLGNGTAKVEEKNCQMPCNGNTTELCGGAANIYLYVAEDLLSIDPCNGNPGGPVSSSVSSYSATSSSSASPASSTIYTTTSSTLSSSSTGSPSSSSSSSSDTSSSAAVSTPVYSPPPYTPLPYTPPPYTPPPYTAPPYSSPPASSTSLSSTPASPSSYSSAPSSSSYSSSPVSSSSSYPSAPASSSSSLASPATSSTYSIVPSSSSAYPSSSVPSSTYSSAPGSSSSYASTPASSSSSYPTTPASSSSSSYASSPASSSSYSSSSASASASASSSPSSYPSIPTSPSSSSIPSAPLSSSSAPPSSAPSTSSSIPSAAPSSSSSETSASASSLSTPISPPSSSLPYYSPPATSSSYPSTPVPSSSAALSTSSTPGPTPPASSSTSIPSTPPSSSYSSAAPTSPASSSSTISSTVSSISPPTSTTSPSSPPTSSSLSSAAPTSSTTSSSPPTTTQYSSIPISSSQSTSSSAKPSTTPISHTTSSAKPSTTASPTTPKTSATLCTSITSITPTSTCEYKVGNWCSNPLPPFSDQTSCLAASSTCLVQLTSCLLSAGFPASLQCLEFSSWCQQISTYCLSSCPGSSCSNTGYDSRYPPPGYTSPSISIKTSIYACPTTIQTTSRPTTTTPVAPLPTCSNICAQPNNPSKGYGSYSPVGSIPLPCYTCNNLQPEYSSGYPFKLYTAQDSADSPRYSRPDCGQGCQDACETQYTGCVETYARSCLDGAVLGDTYEEALVKCEAQKTDCYVVNEGVSGGGRCTSYNSGY